MLKRVEGDDADRVIELPGHEIGDDSFEVASLGFGFAASAPQFIKTIDDEIDGLIRPIRHLRRRPVRSIHNPTPRATNRTASELKATPGNGSAVNPVSSNLID